MMGAVVVATRDGPHPGPAMDPRPGPQHSDVDDGAAARVRRPRDHDLDSSTHAAALPRDEPPETYLRVVANPCLPIALLFLGLALTQASMRDGERPSTMGSKVGTFLALCVAPVVVGLPWLIHYHCLDCGATGAIRRWKDHVCPKVAERRALHRPRRFRGPEPRVQLALWLWALAVLFAVRLLH
jgi:hypothetical protein